MNSITSLLSNSKIGTLIVWLGDSVKAIIKSRSKRRLFILLTVTECVSAYMLYKRNYTDIKAINGISAISIISVLFLLNVGTVLLIGSPLVASIAQTNGFRRAGLINKENETPSLLRIIQSDDNTVSYVYHNRGIPLKTFIDRKEAIEASLNIIALDIRQGADRSHIIIKAVSGQHQLPDRIDWNDRYLSAKPSEILLGVSEADVMRIDLDALPHIQCGGITGSGKSVLLRCVLHQLYMNGFQIYLCDFKNLIDFSSKERQVYDCLTSKEELLNVLQRLVGIMNTRKELFASEYCANITEYNAKHAEDPCKRIMLASDEIAYAFQRKGLADSSEKALVNDIEATMSLIAQQGRFAGIHLWLSTQRGDADTIPPQIRSNLTVRICGRASDVLSRVTIDSSVASEIPKSLPGRFVNDSEEFFQAFYYRERR